MTDADRLFARAVSPARVVYAPGTGTKRFARDMAWIEANSPGVVLTRKQAAYLRRVVVRFRRQIPADIVAMAQRDLAAPEGGG